MRKEDKWKGGKVERWKRRKVEKKNSGNELKRNRRKVLKWKCGKEEIAWILQSIPRRSSVLSSHLSSQMRRIANPPKQARYKRI